MILLSDHGISNFHDLIPVTGFQRSCSSHHGIRPKIKSSVTVQMSKTDFFFKSKLCPFRHKVCNLHLELLTSNNDQIRALANPDQDLPMPLFGVVIKIFFEILLICE